MLTQQAIIDFCNQYDYDIRKSGNGRWIDQKCAADVVTVVADCIYNYALQDEDGIFTSTEIWHYDYTVENVEAIFKKPGVEMKPQEANTINSSNSQWRCWQTQTF